MNFHGGQLKQSGVMDFSVNIPSIPFEETYRDLLIRSIDQLVDYPEIDGVTARNCVASILHIDPRQVVLGNGATDLIYLISRSNRFGKVGILEPTFTEYERALKQEGTLIHPIALIEESDTFDLQAEVIAAEINQNQLEALFICNPNNPTGHLISAVKLEQILRQVDHKSFVLVIDESFIEFKAHKGHQEAMKNLINRYNIVIIRSMTKTYRVPGLRIGYIFGTMKVIEKITNTRDPWALNHFALMSIPYFMEQQDFVLNLQKWCLAESEYMQEELKSIKNLSVYQNEANFILIKIPEDKSKDFYEKMIYSGIHLRKCTDFKGLGNRYFRLAIMNRKQNSNLIKILREALND